MFMICLNFRRYTQVNLVNLTTCIYAFVKKYIVVLKGGSRILASYSGQDATVGYIWAFRFNDIILFNRNPIYILLKEVFNAFHKEMDKVNKYAKLYHIGRLHPAETSNNQFTENGTELEFDKNNQIRQDFAKLRKLAFDMVG